MCSLKSLLDVPPALLARILCLVELVLCFGPFQAHGFKLFICLSASDNTGKMEASAAHELGRLGRLCECPRRQNGGQVVPGDRFDWTGSGALVPIGARSSYLATTTP